jgi:hypothetical protein
VHHQAHDKSAPTREKIRSNKIQEAEMKAGRIFILGLSWVVMAGWGMVAMAQAPDTLWTRTYGGTGDDVGRSIQITGDGGYIIAGYINSFGAQDYDMYLIRTNEIGDTLWTRSYGGVSDQQCNSVQVTPDGGYMLVGNIGSSSSYRLYIVRTTSRGDILWTRSYMDVPGANSIHSTDDGGYVIAGGLYIMKINSEGDSLWMRSVNGWAYCAKQTIDGGYLVVGTWYVLSNLSYMHITKFDANGSYQWESDYYYYSQHTGGYNSWNYGYDFVQTPGGEFIVVGTAGYYYYQAPWWEEEWTHYYFVKTTSSGSMISHQIHTANGYTCAFAVCMTQNGAFAMAGGLAPYEHLGEWSNFYLLKESSGLVSEWATTYGGAAAYDIEQTSDGGYIIVGASGPYGSPDDVYLVKTGPDSFETAVTTDRKATIPVVYKIYPPCPNPFNETTTILYEVPIQGRVRVNVYDILGRQVATVADGVVNPGSYSVV